MSWIKNISKRHLLKVKSSGKSFTNWMEKMSPV